MLRQREPDPPPGYLVFRYSELRESTSSDADIPDFDCQSHTTRSEAKYAIIVRLYASNNTLMYVHYQQGDKNSGIWIMKIMI